MRERASEYQGHKLTIFTAENADEIDYLKHQNMYVFIAEQGISFGEMFTAEEFYMRLKNPSRIRIPIMIVTSSKFGVYDTVTSVDNL